MHEPRPVLLVHFSEDSSWMGDPPWIDPIYLPIFDEFLSERLQLAFNDLFWTPVRLVSPSKPQGLPRAWQWRQLPEQPTMRTILYDNQLFLGENGTVLPLMSLFKNKEGSSKPGKGYHTMTNEGVIPEIEGQWRPLNSAFRYFASLLDSIPIETSVEIWSHPQTNIHSPAFWKHSCELKEGSVLGPFTVLGQNIKLEKNARLERCIVISDTTIGKNTFWKEKIILGDRVLNPLKGVWTHIKDKKILKWTPRRFFFF